MPSGNHGFLRRPKPPFLTAEWRYLLMLNYEIDPAILRPLVPRGTELDPWEGHTLISLVGFRFLGTRIGGWSVPGHRDFDEINLRFYVRRRDSPGWRRAVVFILEIVPRPAIALVARMVYHEPYRSLPMRHTLRMDGAHRGEPGLIRYEWRQADRWYRLEGWTTGTPVTPAAGSEAEFITEHYWGYTARRDGGCLEYQVAHPPWRVWGTSSASLECDVGRMYGSGFEEALRPPPRSAFVAEGSSVAVFRGVQLREPV